MKRPKPIKPGIYFDMPDDVYHEQHAPEHHYYSSSQLKLILKDPQEFKDKYITKTKGDKGNISAFDLGTYVHTAVLEPERFDEATAVYKGSQRRGKAWDKFKEENEGKTIIVHDAEKHKAGALTELTVAKSCIESVENNEEAQEILAQGQAEVSIFLELDGLRVKARGDWVDFQRMILGDLKTTKDDVRKVSTAKRVTKDFGYDLSCALYLDIFNQYVNTEGHPNPSKNQKMYFESFDWIYAIKPELNAKGEYKTVPGCKVWPASQRMIELGRKKYKKAIRLIKKYEALDWEIIEETFPLDPDSWDEKEWMSEDEGKGDVKKKEKEPVKKKTNTAKSKKRRQL